jgi:hypothetical protein
MDSRNFSTVFVSLVLFFVFFLTSLTAARTEFWSEPEPVKGLNSEFEEWSPFLSSGGSDIYFARVRTDDSYYGRIFKAQLSYSGSFETIAEVNDVTMHNYHVLYPWVSPDNLRIYYHVEALGRYELRYSQRASVDEPWPRGLGIYELNSLCTQLRAPRLTQDELVIVFAANDVPGGRNGWDIYMADRVNRNEPFNAPVSLARVNTAYSDCSPSISSDGLAIYFASDRADDGRFKIYVATRPNRASAFDNVWHLSTLDNPDGHSVDPLISKDEKTIFLVFQCADNRSNRDIYVSYLQSRYNDYQACEPYPADGQIGVLTPLVLKWTPGKRTAYHNLYIGTTPNLTEKNAIKQLVNSMYFPTMEIVPGKVYYWRVDEVEADGVTKHVGQVWSFTVSKTTLLN